MAYVAKLFALLFAPVLPLPFFVVGQINADTVTDPALIEQNQLCMFNIISENPVSSHPTALLTNFPMVDGVS